MASSKGQQLQSRPKSSEAIGPQSPTCPQPVCSLRSEDVRAALTSRLTCSLKSAATRHTRQGGQSRCFASSSGTTHQNYGTIRQQLHQLNLIQVVHGLLAPTQAHSTRSRSDAVLSDWSWTDRVVIHMMHCNCNVLPNHDHGGRPTWLT